jgi:hypothetical protein
MSLIEVITCIRDGVLEDQIISAIPVAIPDCTILLRSHEINSAILLLSNELSRDGTSLRRVVLFHDCDAGDLGEIRSLQSALSKKKNPEARERSLLIIDINNLNLRNQTILIEEISNLIRSDHNPQIPSEQRKLLAFRNLVLMTGTSGSPGITTVAANLAWNMAETHATSLIDRDPQRRDLALLFSGRGEEEFFSVSPNLIISRELPVREEADISIVDGGAMIDLIAARTDRRQPAREFIDLVDLAALTIFVAQPESAQLHEIERFINQREELSRFSPLLIFLNKFLPSRDHRIFFKSLTRMNPQEPVLIGHRDLGAIDRSKRETLPLAQISTRSKIRRDLQVLTAKALEILDT